MNDQLAAVDQAKSTILDLAVRFGPKLLAAMLILVVGLFVTESNRSANLAGYDYGRVQVGLTTRAKF